MPIALPAQRALRELIAAVGAELSGRKIGIGGSGAGITTDDEHVLPELLRGDLEQELGPDEMNVEHPLAGLRLARDDTIVRLRPGLTPAIGGVATSTSSLLARASGTLLRRSRLRCGPGLCAGGDNESRHQDRRCSNHFRSVWGQGSGGGLTPNMAVRRPQRELP